MSLLGAIGGILGGLLSKPKTISAGDNAYSHVGGIMEAAEQFGFNPLTLLGAVPSMGATQVGGNPVLGAAVADAGMMLADGLAKKKVDEEAQLRMQNYALKRTVERMTIRPKVGGIYARQEMTPTMGEALGVSDASASDRSGVAGGLGQPSGGGANLSFGSAVAPDLRPLPTVDLIDSRRKVEQKAVPSSSGFVVVDNPHVPFPIYVPSLDGDETLGPDVITFPLSVAGSAAYHYGSKYARYRDRDKGVGPVMSVGGQLFQMEKPRRKKSEFPLGWTFDVPKKPKKKGALAPLGF